MDYGNKTSANHHAIPLSLPELENLQSKLEVTRRTEREESMSRQIESILVEGVGYIYTDQGGTIETFTVNGEMAPVTWYRRGDQEWNGKYVIEVNYSKS